MAKYAKPPETDAVGGGAAGRLWHLTKGHRAGMGLVTAAAVLAVLLEVSVAAFVALIVGALIDARTDDAFFWSVALLISTIVACGMQTVASLVSHRVAIRVQSAIRIEIGAKLSRAPLGLVQSFGTTDVRRLLMEDVERIEDGIAHLVPDLTAALLAPLAVGIVMTALDWRMALAALAPMLAGSIALSTIMRRDDGLSRRFVEAQTAVASALQEAIAMMPVVKAYGLQTRDLKRVDKAFTNLDLAVAKWLSFGSAGTNWFYLATTSTLVVVLPLGLWLHPLPAGTPIVTFFTVAAFSFSSINARLFGAVGRLRLQEASLARIASFLSLPDMQKIEDAPPGGTLDLHLEGVHFSYGDNFSLKDIDLHIGFGQKVALVGPSGSGKSTIARLFLRHFDPDRGRVTLGGSDLRSLAPNEIADRVTAVLQETFLFSRSVHDNIALGRPGATHAEIERAAALAQAHDFILSLPAGYQTLLSNGQGLSGGQSQRIAIARAILKDAPILVLDEATAYADPESQSDIQHALTELGQGKTVIAIAHRLSTIVHFDRIVYLEDGRILESGTHEELLALDGRYARQWRSHVAACRFSFAARSCTDG